MHPINLTKGTSLGAPVDSQSEDEELSSSDVSDYEAKIEAKGDQAVAGRSSKATNNNLKTKDIPQTEAEAREHIEKVRSAIGSEDSESSARLGRMVESALTVLAEQLYRESTRFLQELIQNMDDNLYEVQIPTMKITYKDKTLRVDCNEIGFSKANVEAICDIGSSSKRGVGNGTAHIGEKGIGFKSVFKVADVVYISSGHYSFKFDRRTRLGMITPVWEKFPAERLPGFTTLILKISPQYDVKVMLKELEGLDAKILLFLKNIREVNVRICKRDGYGADSPGNRNWETTLKRKERPILDNKSKSDQREVFIQSDQSSVAYTVFHHSVSELSVDERRPGARESRIQLAFPSTKSNELHTESQKVYAFLPIRDHGFKFMLQADFLLTANREDIDSSLWNKTLLNQIPEALLIAIRALNNGPMRYTWLGYLPRRPPLDDFFRDFPEKTMAHLSKQPILESTGGNLIAPAALIYVPEHFTDRDGKPLIYTSTTGDRFLSNKYPSEYQPEFRCLGLSFLSSEGFLQGLKALIDKNTAEFQMKTASWHSRLSQVLDLLIIESGAHKRVIAGLPIVPLRNGSWVSSKISNLFFPLKERLVIPSKIGVFEVHPDAANDSHRRHLLMVLGVRETRKDLICSLIIERHEDETFDPASISAYDLISHAIFLYRASYSQQLISHDIWLLTENALYYPSSQVYIDSDPQIRFTATEMLGRDRSKFSFLHKDYKEAFIRVRNPWNPADHWKGWLIQELNMSAIPRLVNIAGSAVEGPFRLSDEFQLIVKNNHSSEWLLLLKTHWQDYSRYIISDDLGKDRDDISKEQKLWLKSQEDLREALSSKTFECLGGVTARLCQTCLPKESVAKLAVDSATKVSRKDTSDEKHGKKVPQKETYNAKHEASYESVSFILLNISDPDDPRWDFLKHFGVLVELGAGIFIHHLRRMRYIPATLLDVSKVYDQIQGCSRQKDIDLIRCSFREEALIFIPSENIAHPRKWVKLENCIWCGPECLKRTKCLEPYYPNNHILFCDILRLGNAGLEDYVSEVRQITSTDTLDYIAQVFVILSQTLELPMAKIDNSELASIIRCPIFPVQIHSKFHHIKPALESDVWYIADRPHLADNFKGRLPLLAFEKEAFDKMQTLIRKLGLEQRFLSRIARSETLVEGKAEPSIAFTKSLRAKSRFIALLIPKSRQDKEEIARRIRRIEVYQSDSVVVKWTVQTRNGSIIEGRTEAGWLKLDMNSSTIRLFLRKEDTTDATPPVELPEALAQVCSIRDPEHLLLLSFILMQSDIQRIKDDLRRRGIVDTTPESDAESISTWMSDGAVRAPPKSETTQNVHFETLRNGILSLSGPVPSLYSKNECDTKFMGELFVSNLLRKYLGDEYLPNVHWTSPLRSHAGHSPYQASLPDTSTFTITDNSGNLTELLKLDALLFKKRPILHMEVNTTELELRTTFRFDACQYKKAYNLRLAHNTHKEQRELYILVRVYNVYRNPSAALFLDPWQMCIDGFLRLEVTDSYSATFNKTAKAIYLSSATSSDANPENGAYKYQRLKHLREIRLLEITPGNRDAPLEGAIRHVSIDSKQPFWALSYVWGTFTPLAPYYLKTPNGMIPVTSSLHSALRSMRERGVSAMLWADAVCINQQDLLEKGIQIRLLRTIYQYAERVIAWIGEEENDSHEALRRLNQVQINSQESMFKLSSENMATKQGPTIGDDDWEGINNILKRAWFRRVWIVQELVLPSNVVIACGRTEIGWDDFFDALALCQDHLNSENPGRKITRRFLHGGPAFALGQTRRRFQDDARRYSLLELLHLFKHTKATKKRDKLFALLGLASDADERDLNPDYDSPLEDVIRRYASCFVARRQVMDLLYRAGTTKSYRFCSWIPNWTGDNFPTTISNWEPRRNFYAGRGIPPEARLDDVNPSMLIVKGCSVDTIISLSSTRLYPNKIPSFVESAHAMIRFLKSYPTGETHEEVMLRLPIGNARRPHIESADSYLAFDRIHEESVEEDWPPYLQLEISSMRPDQDLAAFHDKPQHTQELLLKYWLTVAAFANRIGNAVFCITKRGYAGLVPITSQVGDEIVVFHGGIVPFVLRRQAWKESVNYSLMGECYVHGIMNGEGLSFEVITDQEFRIL